MYKRCQNTVAQELSHRARHVNSSAVWLADVPECIKHLVLRDCNAAMTDNQYSIKAFSTRIKKRMLVDKT